MKKIFWFLCFAILILAFTRGASSQTGVQQLGGTQFANDSTIHGSQLIAITGLNSVYSVTMQLSVICLTADIRVFTGTALDSTSGTYAVIPAGVPWNKAYYKPNLVTGVWFQLNSAADTAKIYYDVEGY